MGEHERVEHVAVPEMHNGELGLGFRVSGFGFGVLGLGFGGWGLGIEVEGLTCL